MTRERPPGAARNADNEDSSPALMEAALPVTLEDHDWSDSLDEVEVLERYASQDELLSRSANIAAAAMLQDSIVTVLSLMLELEKLSRSSNACEAFVEFAEKLGKIAAAEAEREVCAGLSEVAGEA